MLGLEETFIQTHSTSYTLLQVCVGVTSQCLTCNPNTHLLGKHQNRKHYSLCPEVVFDFGRRSSELQSRVFGRKELHQVRPDRHHSHGDGAQSGNAARAGSAGGPAHAGAEEKSAAALTVDLSRAAVPTVLQRSSRLRSGFPPPSHKHFLLEVPAFSHLVSGQFFPD